MGVDGLGIGYRMGKPNRGLTKGRIASLLYSYGLTNALSKGKQLHARMISDGQISIFEDAYWANALLQMYGRCLRLDEAGVLFRRIPAPDIFTWNIALSLYARNGRAQDALRTYAAMLESGPPPDACTFLPLLSVAPDLTTGQMIHARVCAADPACYSLPVATALLRVYAKCGSVARAESTFTAIPRKDLISYNAMVWAYARHGHPDRAFQLLPLMEMEGVKPDKITLVCLLNASARLGCLRSGSFVHARMIATVVELDGYICSVILNMYSMCGNLQNSVRVFDRIRSRPRHAAMWNTMILSYLHNGEGGKALELFKAMGLEGAKPDRITFLYLVNACSSLACSREGKSIHKCLIASGFGSDVGLKNALLKMYGKCSSVEDARSVFSGLIDREIASCNAMLAVLTENGCAEEAIELFHEVILEGVKPNKATFICILNACISLSSLENGRRIHKYIDASGFASDVNVMTALLNMYAKCGSIKDAQSVFAGMPQRQLVTWNAMIAAYTHYGKTEDALEIFHQMRFEAGWGGAKPDRVTFLCLLNVCGNQASLDYVRCIHELILSSGIESDVAWGTSLLNMYGKCGSLEDARSVFDAMHPRPMAAWNAMLGAYVQNGSGEKALELFQQMVSEGVKPDRVTFLCLLSACGSIPSLENGIAIHKRIIAANGLESDVALMTALLDMYGKCGSLYDAWAAFDEMHERRIVSWSAMLAAYAQNGCGKEALRLFQQMDWNGERPDVVTFISLLNACNHGGMSEEGWECFVSMSEKYDITPSQEHYACMIDVLGRAEHMCEARDVIRNMHVKLDNVAWKTFMGACNSVSNDMQASKVGLDFEG